MAGATIFRSLAGIISGPVAFLSSSPDNFLRTSSSVHDFTETETCRDRSYLALRSGRRRHRN